jgi:ATP-binding cassette subfamily B protein
VNLHVNVGETLAIVGPPGSGKSSLIRVLLRMYPYQEGSVRIDGWEVAELDRLWLRHQIGVVLQDPFLYSRSIRANLAVGRPGAPEAELVEACHDAAVHDAIRSFPDGFEAMVGERGVTLSGGQRQRLALARALLKDPPILVLDDSLSAVDTGTERKILDAMRRRKGRQTTLIIAHRLSSVMHADRIVVLQEGRVVQTGNHAALAEEPGPYRTLCEIQGALDASIRADTNATGHGNG